MLGKEIARDPFALHANKARHRHAVYFGSIPAEAESFTVQLGFDAPNLMAGDRLTFDHLDFAVMPRETDPAWTQVKEPEPPRVRITSKTPFVDPFAPLVVSIKANGAKIDWEKLRVKFDGRTTTKQFRRESGRISYVPEKEWTPGLHTVDIEFLDTSMHDTPPEVYDRTDAMKAVDPTRITVQADVIRSWDAFSAYRPFVKATDGLLPEIYPVHEVTPNPMPSCVAETTRDMKKFHSDVAEAGDGSPRTVWPIIQNFKGWTSWKRFPTQDELYAMSFASIIHGANGITWYTYGGTIIPEKKKFNYGITTSEEIWRGMTKGS